ncbi:hypothetical protein ACIPJN_29095 [Streptomyces sp. NPDC086796]|uniref:hypothetical protein n=1 Tax=Streptomyces sp. NPDC086796 TaxID=3365760 RepID=UPI0037FE290E
MPAPSSTPPTGTPAYWAVLEDLADAYVFSRATSAPGDLADAQRVMTRMRPYGAAGLIDLSTLLVLIVVDRCPQQLRDKEGRPDIARLIGGQAEALTTIHTASAANAQLGRGHVTATDLDDAEQQIALIQQLEATVGEALRTRPGHAKARRNVRRILAEQGAGLREASALFGIVSEVAEAIGGQRPTAR